MAQCSTEFCTSPRRQVEESGYDCRAGSPWEACTCKEGYYPKATGETEVEWDGPGTVQ